MSQIFRGFVEMMKQAYGKDLKQMGVDVEWREVPDGGEEFSGVNLSCLGVGVDREKNIIYTGVVFGKDDLVAPPGQSARTKSRLRRGVIYGEVAISPNGEFSVTAGLGPIGALLDDLDEVSLSAHLVNRQFNDWSIEPANRLVFDEASGWRIWKIGQTIEGEETLAKIAIPLPKEWRVEWDSGHHALGYVQSLSVWPI